MRFATAIHLIAIFVGLVVVNPATPTSGGDLRFRLRGAHRISETSEYAACAVFDVNGDGKKDLVCGGSWYEAPDWKPHFLREVERIGNRFDDYSSLPLDVNGDGHLDLVSVNYRSKSLYWVENPGAALKTNLEAPWAKHPIDTPGPSETGRLHDIDGDGRLDLLPNGTSYAAWWSTGAEKGKPYWDRHDLPADLIGHGIGFGDINGDGRGDIICPKGWAEAPLDQFGDRRAQELECAADQSALDHRFAAGRGSGAIATSGCADFRLRDRSGARRAEVHRARIGRRRRSDFQYSTWVVPWDRLPACRAVSERSK